MSTLNVICYSCFFIEHLGEDFNQHFNRKNTHKIVKIKLSMVCYEMINNRCALFFFKYILIKNIRHGCFEHLMLYDMVVKL